MKKNLKYFENELNRINKEFAEYKKQHMEKPEIGKTVEIAGMEWMILDKTEKGYFAVLNGFDGKERAFDSDSNNWISSKLISHFLLFHKIWDLWFFACCRNWLFFCCLDNICNCRLFRLFLDRHWLWDKFFGVSVLLDFI